MHYLRLLALSGVLALAACSGSGTGGLGNIFGGGSNSNQCYPGQDAQVASPQPGQGGVPTNIGQVVIVTHGNSNALSNDPGNWHLFITDNFGGIIDSSSLTPVDGRSLTHPWADTDFYYGASIPTLNPGMTYTVRLQQGADNVICTPYPLQSFST